MLKMLTRNNLWVLFISFASLLFTCNCLLAQDKFNDVPVYNIGDEKEFWMWNLNVMPPEDKELSATCRGVGERVYVFVSDDVWEVDVFESECSDDFLIKVVKIGNDDSSNSKVEDIKLSKPIEIFDVSDVGMDCREIVLVVSVLKPTKRPVAYSFSASLIPQVEAAPSF